jgi:dephospho-CoA kinase
MLNGSGSFQPALPRKRTSWNLALSLAAILAIMIPGTCTVIGITGGISTGKSTFSRRLHELLAARLFDADRAARQLTDDDPEVRELLGAEFGPGIFSARGDLNRAALRAIVFADQGKKRALEQILHPRIRRQWAAEADRSRQSGKIFLADIPLLYETEGESLCDRVVVVASSQEIQLQRLIARTRLSPADARAMIFAQMPLTQKIARADHVAWNNGPLSNLDAQAAVLARFLAKE